VNGLRRGDQEPHRDAADDHAHGRRRRLRHRGHHRRRELGIYDDRFLPGLTRLADAIHRGGAKASIQLGHGGGHMRRDI